LKVEFGGLRSGTFPKRMGGPPLFSANAGASAFPRTDQ